VNRPNAASRAGAGYRRDEDVTDELQGAAAEEGRTSGPAGDGVVVLAAPRGFCAGVRRAIGVVERALDTCFPDLAGPVERALDTCLPDLAGPASDDICYASQNRPDAVEELAGRTDLVLVVGSPNSSNSVRMVEVGQIAGTPAHLVPDVSHLDGRWFAGVGAVGLSAGASAPEVLVEEGLDQLRDMGYKKVQMATVATENVIFSLPSAVAGPRGGGT
jgi:4-hydroxy-3-methylbut-2-enyl diphosphate reductase IspH